MTETIKRKTKTVTGISILRKLWLYVLGIFVVIVVICVYVVSAIRQQEPILLPPQEIAVKSEMCFLTEGFEEALSFYAAGWPGKDKDKVIESMKIVHTRIQPLERKLGPVEIRENETFDQATRVVVPILSSKTKNLSTGKVKVLPAHKIMDLLLEKQETAEGQRWFIISPFDPNYAEIKSTWLNLPRKKVPRSPTIILKRAIVMQIIFKGKVTKKSIVYLEQI